MSGTQQAPRFVWDDLPIRAQQWGSAEWKQWYDMVVVRLRTYHSAVDTHVDLMNANAEAMAKQHTELMRENDALRLEINNLRVQLSLPPLTIGRK